VTGQPDLPSREDILMAQFGLDRHGNPLPPDHPLLQR
jgi:hypothetical protein